jgi:NADPH:quinone reductase-like Zn-dependent oxidoreductase
VAKAQLKVPIGATFRLDQVADAHRRVTEHVLGKVVLRIR